MWDLPGPGMEPVSPALAGRFLNTVPPGKSPNWYSCFCSWQLKLTLRSTQNAPGLLLCWKFIAPPSLNKNWNQSPSIDFHGPTWSALIFSLTSPILFFTLFYPTDLLSHGACTCLRAITLANPSAWAALLPKIHLVFSLTFRFYSNFALSVRPSLVTLSKLAHTLNPSPPKDTSYPRFSFRFFLSTDIYLKSCIFLLIYLIYL